MKKIFIGLLILVTVSPLFADENSEFHYQPFKNHFEFVKKIASESMATYPNYYSFDASVFWYESEWQKSFRNGSNNSDREVTVQKEMDWAEFFITFAAYIAEGLLSGYN
jgi:hypothetical protein